MKGRKLFRLPFTRSRIRREMDAELSFHMQERIDELVASGMSRADAEVETLRKFGDRASVEAEVERIDAMTVRRERRREWVADVLRDLRSAARALRRHPVYSAAIVLTVALAIGANSAIYSVAEAVLLRPYDLPGIRRLAVVLDDFPAMGLRNAGTSPAEALDLMKRTDLFEASAGMSGEGAFTDIGGVPTRVTGQRTVGDFFAVAPAKLIKGRVYRAEDSQDGRPPVIVLSHQFWQQLGGDSAIVGRSLTLNAVQYEVIGIAAPEFAFPRTAQYWRPFPLTPNWFLVDQRGSLVMLFLGRLRSDVSFARAAGVLRGVADQWHKDFADGYGKGGHTLVISSFIDREAGQLKPIVLALFGAVVFVLLIACANVASLQLVRAAGRARELAVRAALGAGRAAMARHVMAESALLAVCGGVIGVALGLGALQWLSALNVARFPALRGLSLDGGVLALTAFAVIGAGLVFGAAPTIRAMRTSVNDALRDSSRGSSGGAQRHRFLRTTVIVQQALAMLLLAGAALTLRSLDKLLRVDPGFQPDHVTTFSVTLPTAAYPNGAARIAFFTALEERLKAIPGVERVGFALGVPFTGGAGSTGYKLKTIEQRPDEPVRHANQAYVFGDYFGAMGIQIVRGRALDATDYAAKIGSMVVEETLTKQSFGDADPIGVPIEHGQAGTIVGVARQVKLGDLAEPEHPLIYHNFAQGAYFIATLTAVMRSPLPPDAVLKSARAALAEMDSHLVFNSPRALPDRIAETLAPRRLATNVLVGFAVLALLITVLGVYAVISYIVSTRTREMGIRVALGASHGGIARMIVRDGLVMAVMGLVAGIAAIALLGRAAESLLYDVKPFDPVSLGAAAALLLIVTVLASAWPARRTLRVNPVETLRVE